MTKLRAPALTLLAFLLAGWSCHETRRPEVPATPPAAENTAPSPQPPSPAQLRDQALAGANDAVEAARILALPLDPLDETVIRGMALPMYTELPDLTYDDMLARVKSMGSSHVSVVVSWNQRTIHHNRLRPHPDETPSDARVGALVDTANAAGLRVMLFPIIHVERRNKGEWRGKLAPTEPSRWRDEYRSFILHYAALSQRHGVEILSVGSELSSMENETDWWLSLIADVRKTFEGKLIYSANWDHYETPQYWPALDYIGVSSYFEVAKRSDEPIHLVTQRWREHREDLLLFAAAQDRPLVLTEVGYPAVDSAAVKPWDYTAKTAPNPNAQLAAYRSLSDAWTADDPSFAGLFIWHAWGHGGADDVSYPIWGKTAEPFVRRWYGAP